MRIRITPGIAKGKIAAPPSKSMAHRLLIAAAFADGISVIRGISKCDDVLATLDCLHALGVKTKLQGDDITVYGCNIKKATPQTPLYCRESGSTLRFLVPAAMLSGNTAVFQGARGLMRRPMTVFEKLFREKGLVYTSNGWQITVCGPLKSGDYTLDGNISSQFISGLLFALPLAEEDSTVHILPPVESRSYLNMTVSALDSFGVSVKWKDENTLKISGGQAYKAADVVVEGDASGAAFPDALNLFGGDVQISGLNQDSLQGDAVYRDYFVQLNGGTPTLQLGNCPDLAPILFAVAAAKQGGIFHGTKRLKIKESDRAEVMAKELRKFGTTVHVYEDSVVIEPTAFHTPNACLFGHGDHRIVMALSVLLTLTGGELDGAEAVAKSYPDFFEHLKLLNIAVEEV